MGALHQIDEKHDLADTVASLRSEVDDLHVRQASCSDRISGDDTRIDTLSRWVTALGWICSFEAVAIVLLILL